MAFFISTSEVLLEIWGLGEFLKLASRDHFVKICSLNFFLENWTLGGQFVYFFLILEKCGFEKVFWFLRQFLLFSTHQSVISSGASFLRQICWKTCLKGPFCSTFFVNRKRNVPKVHWFLMISFFIANNLVWIKLC